MDVSVIESFSVCVFSLAQLAEQNSSDLMI